MQQLICKFRATKTGQYKTIRTVLGFHCLHRICNSIDHTYIVFAGLGDSPDPRQVDKNEPESSLSNTRLVFFLFVYLPPVLQYFPPVYKDFTLISRRTAFFLAFSSSSLPSTFLSIGLRRDGNRSCIPSRTEEQRRHGRRGVRRRGGEPAVAAVAEAAAGDELLRAMQDTRRRAQERVQHVLPRLHERRALLPLPRSPPRPPRHPDTEVVVPRRDPGVGDTEGAGHHQRADVHHQQRARGVPKRATAAEARQGRHQHLRGLRAQPPRFLPLLLPRMQNCRHVRRLPPQEEEARRQWRRQEEEGGAQGRAVRLGGLVHEHQRRQQRQEQRRAELHAVDLRQLPNRQQAPQGHPAPVALRQPHRGVLGQAHRAKCPP